MSVNGDGEAGADRIFAERIAVAPRPA